MIFYRSWQPVKALSFDLDDTLYDNQPVIERAEALALAEMQQSYPCTANTDIRFWRKLRRQLLQQQPELISDMGQLRRSGLELGFRQLGMPATQIPQAVELSFQRFYLYRSDFQVAAPIVQVLKKLAQKLPLVAITNGNVDLQAIGISDHFSFSLHASLQQPMKPHPCMFQLAAEKLQLPAGQILHIGDNLEKDVMGAKNAGFQAAWYAEDRAMSLSREAVSVLPDVQLAHLAELELLV